MERLWEADPAAGFRRRLGRPAEGVESAGMSTCPGIWELDNGDVAVIGRDLTEAYLRRMPTGQGMCADESLVVLPRAMFLSVKADLPDA